MRLRRSHPPLGRIHTSHDYCMDDPSDNDDSNCYLTPQRAKPDLTAHTALDPIGRCTPSRMTTSKQLPTAMRLRRSHPPLGRIHTSHDYCMDDPSDNDDSNCYLTPQRAKPDLIPHYSLNVNLSSPNGVRKSLFWRLLASMPANSL